MNTSVSEHFECTRTQKQKGCRFKLDHLQNKKNVLYIEHRGVVSMIMRKQDIGSLG